MGFQLSHQTQIPSLHNFLLATLHFLPFFVVFFFLILILCFGGRDYVDIQFKKYIIHITYKKYIINTILKKIHKNKREKSSQTNSLLQVPGHQKLSLTLAWAKGQRCQGWRDSLSSWLRDSTVRLPFWEDSGIQSVLVSHGGSHILPGSPCQPYSIPLVKAGTWKTWQPNHKAEISDSLALEMLGQRKAKLLSTKKGARKGAFGDVQRIYSSTHPRAFTNSPSQWPKSRESVW